MLIFRQLLFSFVSTRQDRVQTKVKMLLFDHLGTHLKAVKISKEFAEPSKVLTVFHVKSRKSVKISQAAFAGVLFSILRIIVIVVINLSTGWMIIRGMRQINLSRCRHPLNPSREICIYLLVTDLSPSREIFGIPGICRALRIGL